MSLSTLWLLTRRGLRSSWGAAAVLGAVALLAALVLTSLPRAAERWHGAMLDHAADQVSALSRDVTLTPLSAPPSFGVWIPGSLRPPAWDGVQSWLEALRKEQPEPLRDVLGPPHLTVSATKVVVDAGPGTDIIAVSFVLRAAPDLADHARLVAGSWPQRSEFGLDWGPDSGLPPIVAPGKTAADIEPTQVVLSRAGAEEIGWTVGSVHQAPMPLPPFKLVGIYEPTDPADGYWQHASQGAEPTVVTNPLSGTIVTVAGTVADEMIGPVTQSNPQLAFWYPVDLSGVPGGETSLLLRQLRELTAASHASVGLDDVPVRATTGTTAVLDRVLAQRVGVDAVLAVTVAGPVGALLVVLALGARLVVERRRPALTLLRARGASGREARAVAAAEGAVVGLPGAAVGTALGLVLVPGAFGPGQAAVALASGLAPAVALAATASAGRLGSQRADLGRSPRWRTTAEVLVLLAAAATTWLLVARGAVAAGGVSGGASRPGQVDPLVAVAPALLCLGVAMLVVRALPWLVAPLERALARRRGLVGFLGAARARRDPAGGVLPAVSLVLCVAVAASSSVLRTTIDVGIADAAWEHVGADVRIADVWISPEQVKALRAAEGVSAVATLTGLGRGTVTAGGTQVHLSVIAVDAADLARVQEGVPGAPPAAALAALTRDDGRALPMLVSESSGLSADAEGELAREGSTRPPPTAHAVGTIAVLPGMPPAARFVVVDAARAAQAFESTDLPGVAFVRLDRAGGGTALTASAHVPAAVRAVFPSAGAHLETAADAAAEVRGSPSTRALEIAAALALVLAAVLVALTVVLTLLLAGPARARLLAVLRSLGSGPRQGRVLVASETAPWIAVALLAGAVLAWAVPAVVLAAIDLTPLTEGSAAPTARYDLATLAALGAGLVLIGALAGALVAVWSGRDVAARLRTGEDR
ncbi:hypothetical protein [Xylanimonas sp. McL0601]|uniref:hypothetical protein n=1 Tax=Xylanimonas sp. McL0601 TaxID=3414739 RepID=UPI003CEA9D8A